MARWALALALAPAGFVLLLARPEWDVHWEDHRAHFWLVFSVALVCALLGLVMSEAARRRGDARVFLVGLAFLASSGFLGLHALATPGVLLDGKNTGFVIATPIGLFLAAILAAMSGLDFSAEQSMAIVRRERWIRAALLLLLAAWAVWSLASLPPLDRPLPPSDADGPLIGFAIAGGALYAFAAWRYLQLYRQRPAFLLVAVTVSWVLLTEALVAIAFARNWHATWWEWHLLMAAAFLLVAAAVRREYRERGSAAEALDNLYLQHTVARVHDGYAKALADLAAESERGGDISARARDIAAQFGLAADQAALLERAAAQLRDIDRLYRPYVPAALASRLREDPGASELGGAEREITVLFADLQGFTAFSEHADPGEVITMLNAYWAVTVPVVVREYGGLIERFSGDAVMVVFNAAADQPDHARRAVAAALAMQRAADAVAGERPSWPRFRAGVNTGPAIVGNVGTAEQRSFAAIGDTTNLASRLQTAAAPGQVVIGSATAEALGDVAVLEPLGIFEVKGRKGPVEAFAVVRLD
ncbi:MAG: adenylate/guanylate cyclase domain-containing protein [Gaiellaceae bacterium]